MASKKDLLQAAMRESFQGAAGLDGGKSPLHSLIQQHSQASTSPPTKRYEVPKGTTDQLVGPKGTTDQLVGPNGTTKRYGVPKGTTDQMVRGDEDNKTPHPLTKRYEVPNGTTDQVVRGDAPHSPPQAQPEEPPAPSVSPMRLGRAQREVMDYLLRSGTHITTTRAIATATGNPFTSTKHVLQRLEEVGAITKTAWGRGAMDGLKIVVDEAKIRALLTARPQTKRYHVPKGTSYQMIRGTAPEVNPNPHTKWYEGPNGTRDQMVPLLEEEEEKSSSSLAGEENPYLDPETFGMRWSQLAREGFGPVQLRRVLDALRTAGMPLDHVWRSLDRAEWLMARGGIKDGKGALVGNPGAYLTRVLVAGDYLPRPQGWTDKHDREETPSPAADAQEPPGVSAECVAWLVALTPEERRVLLDRRERPVPEHVWLQMCFSRPELRALIEGKKRSG